MKRLITDLVRVRLTEPYQCPRGHTRKSLSRRGYRNWRFVGYIRCRCNRPMHPAGALARKQRQAAAELAELRHQADGGVQ